MSHVYVIRCDLPDGRVIRELRDGTEGGRAGAIIFRTPTLERDLGPDTAYFIIGGGALRRHDHLRAEIGPQLPEPQLIPLKDVVAGARGYFCVDVPSRNGGELAVRGAWVPCTVVATPGETMLKDGRALPSTTRAVILREPSRVPADGFVLSASGMPWTRDGDGTPQPLGSAFSSGVMTLGQCARQGGGIIALEAPRGGTWFTEELP